MNLSQYRRKRDFKKSPEPAGQESVKSGPLRFVVQMHHASRLHFDFRLQVGGVLKSWAVPKGPSLNPADKRLAVMVEDHPLDYRSFEGVIPAGNYGAGKVIVWDEGTYAVPTLTERRKTEDKVKEGLQQGHLRIVLKGRKLKGEFTLVKLPKGKDNSWLLIKKQDRFADADFAADDRSVLSGRALEQIGERPPAKHPRATSAPAKAVVQPIKRRPRAEAFVRPMLATLVQEPFDRAGWIFEVKWDGYRAIAEVDGDDVRLYSRNQQSFNAKYAPIVDSLKKLGEKARAILDGEIVVLDEAGISQFQMLQNYQKTGGGPLVYYIFDLLALNGKDLRKEPLVRRKELLAGLLKGQTNLRISEHVERDGVAFFAAAAKQGLEGMVAKNAKSQYREGVRSRDWLKVKTHERQEAVIAGFTQPKGRRQNFGALVLGVYDRDRLVYIGHVGAGFDDRDLADLKPRLDRLRQQPCPLAMRPQTNAPAQWVAPQLVCEVQFQGWSRDGHMRHPVFLGLRADKRAHLVQREKPLESKRAVLSNKADLVRHEKPLESEQAVMSNQSEPAVRLTNQDKLFWPEEGITKGDVIEYYRDIAPMILPYLHDRPESLHRHPNGIHGPSFFQKDVSRQPPPEMIETFSIRLENEKRKILAPLCQNESSLLYLANLGCIELNPWNSRIARIDSPDYVIIDLDPEDTPFAQVVETALAVRQVLDQAEAPGYCKTSGKRGLHIYVPLGARYDYQQARQFAQIVANMVHEKLPELTSVLRSPAKRQKKVYLDYLQNSRGQTLAAPYSIRPYPGATVSTPLQWSEVTRRLDPSRFTIHSMRRRLDKLGDLWQPVVGAGIDIEACLDRLHATVPSKARAGS